MKANVPSKVKKAAQFHYDKAFHFSYLIVYILDKRF